MINEQEIRDVAALNNNRIPENLIESLGYNNDEETRNAIKALGIEITDPIEEKDLTKKVGKLTNQECLHFVTKAQQGDENAWETLFLAWKPYLLLLATQICRNHKSDIEDIMSEGIMGLIKAIQTFNPSMSLYFAGYANLIIKRYMQKENNKVITPFKMWETAEITTLNLISWAGEHGIESWDEADITEAAKAFKMSEKRVKTYISYFNCFNLGCLDSNHEMGEDGYHGHDETMPSKRKYRYRNQSSSVTVGSAEDRYFDENEEDTVASTLILIKDETDRNIFADYAGLNEDEKEYNIKELCDKYNQSRHHIEKSLERSRKILIKKIA